MPKVYSTNTRYIKPRGPNSAVWKGGRVRMGPDFYIGIFMPNHPRSNSQGYVREHVVVAENALGKPLPRLSVVHHIDENQENNSNSNLVICQDNAYHRMLHARMKIKAAGGNPNLEKWCDDCRCPKPKTEFPRLSRSPDGLGRRCRKCVSINNKDRYARRLK